MDHPTLWQRIKMDIRERFLTFESLNGWMVFIPWGAGFLYFANCDLVFRFFPTSSCSLADGYAYAFNSVGIVLVVWGLRKGLVNRVKQAAAVAEMVEKRAAVNEVLENEKILPVTINLKEV